MEFIKTCSKHNCDKIYRERFVKGKLRREYICKLCVKDKNSLRGDKYDASGKAYRNANKEHLSKQRNKNKKFRRQTDQYYRLREDISVIINTALKRNNSSKNGLSCFKFVNYTIIELKSYLEGKFEYWMNWENKGIYRVDTWDDKDQSTWRWNVDHIIPQSDLLYSSMEDDNFKKCWALDNLRPYSAKQNCLDGANRTRHI